MKIHNQGIRAAATRKTACAVVGIHEGALLSPSARALDKASGGLLQHILQQKDFSAKVGATLVLYRAAGLAAERVLLVGCGAEQPDCRAFCVLVESALAALQKTGAREAVLYLSEIEVRDAGEDEKLRHIGRLAGQLEYRPPTAPGASAKRAGKITALVVASSATAANNRSLEEGLAIAAGLCTARTLADLPANICTPRYLAQEARKLARQQRRLRAEVLNEEAMGKLGMHALLSVSAGSREPARLILLHYRGAAASKNPYVLVGKGITFDTGGISIKPSGAMDEMKYDMSGAATVLGTLQAVAQMALPINVVGIVASAENMPGGQATRPGDVITSMSGQTIEVLNTDAEGRLVLCDALHYATRFKPCAMIDVATLTGACLVALGREASALFSNNPELRAALEEAAETSQDRVWPMPLWKEYGKQLKSNFADLANIGGRDAGSITAAYFLSRFVGTFPWVHLDVAGTAWKTGQLKGSTGRPVPLLCWYLLKQGARRRHS